MGGNAHLVPSVSFYIILIHRLALKNVSFDDEMWNEWEN